MKLEFSEMRAPGGPLGLRNSRWPKFRPGTSCCWVSCSCPGLFFVLQVVPEGGAVIGKPTLEVPDKSAEIKESERRDRAQLISYHLLPLPSRGQRAFEVWLRASLDAHPRRAASIRFGWWHHRPIWASVDSVTVQDGIKKSPFRARLPRISYIWPSGRIRNEFS